MLREAARRRNPDDPESALRAALEVAGEGDAGLIREALGETETFGSNSSRGRTRSSRSSERDATRDGRSRPVDDFASRVPWNDIHPGRAPLPSSTNEVCLEWTRWPWRDISGVHRRRLCSSAVGRSRLPSLALVFAAPPTQRCYTAAPHRAFGSVEALERRCARSCRPRRGSRWRLVNAHKTDWSDAVRVPDDRRARLHGRSREEENLPRAVRAVPARPPPARNRGGRVRALRPGRHEPSRPRPLVPEGPRRVRGRVPLVLLLRARGVRGSDEDERVWCARRTHRGFELRAGRPRLTASSTWRSLPLCTLLCARTSRRGA